MQLHTEIDIDRAIEELSAAVGDLFKGERREIERIKSRIAARRSAHQSTIMLQHRLCELMAAQLRREISWGMQ